MLVPAGALPRRCRIGRTAGRISRHESRRVGSPPLVGRGGGGGRAIGARRSAFFLAATPSPTLPRKGTAVRGKSAIAELQLIEGCSWRGAASIHWGRPSYFGEGSTREQELADELGEPKRKHRDAVEPGCDAEQQVGDHCCQDLQTDRVVVGAE